MQVIKREDLRAFIAKDGSEIREICNIYGASLAEAVVSAGKQTKLHFHRASDEVYYILEGVGLIELNDEVHQVSEGCAVVIPHGCRHRIKNMGNRILRFLCVCSPPYSDDDTVLLQER